MASERMTVQEAGRRGGRATSAKYGRDFYQRIGNKGGDAVADKYGHEHFVQIGQKGGKQSRHIYAAGRAALGLPPKG